MKIINEIKNFAVKGNVIDMAVGIVIGSAFTSIVKSTVDDIINPILGLFTKGVDLSDMFILLKAGKTGTSYTTLAQATADGAVTINIGRLCNNIISFIIVAVVLFFIIKVINRLRELNETPSNSEILLKTKNCPYCFSTIHIEATKCPNCTSKLIT